ncbi:MAG: four-helix bundle copper-binding protein [Methylophilaceae bacterium]|uniref:four-helix bundle copper-binding protein n=1 Tax=Methylovorus sp. MM2 TaxID=1848038 RepID=UPI0009EDF734|nr:four-helix bundle copper-binding protein [Methylovorus sp. MM2]
MVNEQYQRCIDACKKAILASEVCADACRSEGHSPMMQRCVSLDTDCAEFCRMAVRFMQRESEFVDLICEDCAEICRECADECIKHPADHCQECAKACYACMDECLRMVSH